MAQAAKKATGKKSKATAGKDVPFAPEFEAPESAETIGFDGLVQMASADVMKQPRAREIRYPVMLHIEPLTPMRKDASQGNDRNDKNRVHQFDPNRPSSCMGVMPCWSRFLETGNPYPAAKDDPAIDTSPAWVNFTPLGFHTFAELASRKEPVTITEAFAAIVKRAGMDVSDKTVESKALRAIKDAFRDLRGTAFNAADRVSANIRSTKWMLVKDLKSVKLSPAPTK